MVTLGASYSEAGKATTDRCSCCRAIPPVRQTAAASAVVPMAAGGAVLTPVHPQRLVVAVARLMSVAAQRVVMESAAAPMVVGAHVPTLARRLRPVVAAGRPMSVAVHPTAAVSAVALMGVVGRALTPAHHQRRVVVAGRPMSADAIQAVAASVAAPTVAVVPVLIPASLPRLAAAVEPPMSVVILRVSMLPRSTPRHPTISLLRRLFSTQAPALCRQELPRVPSKPIWWLYFEAR